MIAAVVEQWIGFGLIVFFAGFVIADLTRPRTRARPKTRRSERSEKKPSRSS